jgi:nucleotide-binding universal stress UspA family protein
VRDTPLERTLCGLDGSIESERAGIESLGLVALLGGTIRFAHVRNSVKGAEVEPLVGDSAGTLLAKFCEQARQAGIAADSVILEGQTAAALLEHAIAWDASLIAVGTRGLGGFARLRLGGTSHQIVHHCACSVLLCPRRQKPDGGK